MENGKDYVPPALRKRADKTPSYAFFCARCHTEADGYVISDIDNPDHPTTLSVYCHGQRWQIGIEDMGSFRDTMEPYRYVIDRPHPQWFTVFGQPPALDL